MVRAAPSKSKQKACKTSLLEQRFCLTAPSHAGPGRPTCGCAPVRRRGPDVGGLRDKGEAPHSGDCRRAGGHPCAHLLALPGVQLLNSFRSSSCHTPSPSSFVFASRSLGRPMKRARVRLRRCVREERRERPASLACVVVGSGSQSSVGVRKYGLVSQDHRRPSVCHTTTFQSAIVSWPDWPV